MDYLEGSGAEALAHLASCTHCASKAKNIKKTEALLGVWKAVEPSPDFKKKFWLKVKEEKYVYSWKELFSWRWPDIFVPASALAAILIVITSLLMWEPPQPEGKHQQVLVENAAKSGEMVAFVDLLEDQEMLMEAEMISDLDFLLAIDLSSLKKS
jgi:hypothetical protein